MGSIVNDDGSDKIWCGIFNKDIPLVEYAQLKLSSVIPKRAWQHVYPNPIKVSCQAAIPNWVILLNQS